MSCVRPVIEAKLSISSRRGGCPRPLCDGEHELVGFARHRHVGERGAEALDVEALQEPRHAAVEIGLVELGDAELLGAQQGDDPAGRERGVRVHRDERVDDVLVGEIAAVVLGDLDLARQLLERGGGRVGDGALDVEVAARDIELLERGDDGDVDLVLGGGAPRADLVDPVGREHHSLRPAHHRRGLGRPIAGRIEPDLKTLIAHHLAADGAEIGVEHLGGGAAQVGDHAGDIAVVAVDRLRGELLRPGHEQAPLLAQCGSGCPNRPLNTSPRSVPRSVPTSAPMSVPTKGSTTPRMMVEARRSPG